MKKANTDFKGDRVTLCRDGKYRWVYDVNLFTNPTVFFDVVKVMLISMGLVAVFALLIGACTGNITMTSLQGLGTGFVIALAVILALSFVGYLVYAVMVGGKYTVLFILDEKELVHQEYGKTLDKAKLIGELAVIAGAASSRPGTMGMGLTAKTRTSMTTTLSSVRRVVPRRWMHTIKVNERFEKNRVYVKDEDFDFVYNFLLEHCTAAVHN